MTKDKIFAELQKPFPKKAYKDINFGRKMTTIDAYYIVERLTEVFGPCGVGWGLCKETGCVSGVPDISVDASCAVAYGALWYKIEDEVGYVVAAGDAKVMKGNFAEAYKKALTNLMSKAASYIGVGLSVYKGEGYDDPYLDQQSAAEKPANSVFNRAKKS